MSVSTAQSPGNAQLLSELDGPRACGLYDLAGVLDNANLVMRVTETPPKLPTIGTDWAHVYNHENLDNIRLISHNGKVVSSVAIFPSVVKTPRGEVSVGGINCFATNPDYRRMGLGEAVLLDAHEKMRANGHHIGLLSTVIHDYYRKFGWESAGRRRRFVFDRGNIGLLPEPTGLDVTEHWQPHSEEMRALHRQKPVFSPRSTGLHEWLAAHKFERVVVAKRDEVVVAYVGAAQDRITEYAGGVDDVAALVRVAFTELDDPRRSTTTRSRVERVTLEMKVWTTDTSDGLPGFLNNL